MFLNITDSEAGNNKDRSAQLVHYLDKEARLFPDAAPERWFSGTEQNVDSYQVKTLIDKNTAKLGRNEAKFFLINISPSQKEIAHLKTLDEKGGKEEFKVFAVKIMDEYARNFKRDNINSNTDLLWFGKLENHRYYSYKDEAVKSGQVKRGMPKPGEQMHIQVIVSRRDITNKIKLSPMNNSRGRNAAHSKTVGQFDRVAFKASGERLFDEMFGFQRLITDSFKYANAQVNGTLKERIAMQELKNARPEQPLNLREKNKDHSALTDLLIENREESLLDLLLAKADYDPLSPALRKKKRRKSKGSEQEQDFKI